MPVDAASDFSAPDGIEPIVGWRMWMLRDNPRWWRRHVPADDWLRSFNGRVWVPGERMEAVCFSPGLWQIFEHGEAPETRCHCGVYAFQNIDPFMPMLHEPVFELVFGEVSLWGKIVVHQDGYRARYAYPKRLWVDKRFPDRLKLAISTYGVPVSTTQDEEFHRLVEMRADLMESDKKDAAVAFLTGTDWVPPWFCPVCRNQTLMPNGICAHCDPEAAAEELERLYQELKNRKREERRQRFPWLYAPLDSVDIPPHLFSEVNKAKLRALAMAGILTVAVASLLTHPPQSL